MKIFAPFAAEKSGRAPLKIVSTRRVGAKPEKMMK
jgi:hypothetical protein